MAPEEVTKLLNEFYYQTVRSEDDTRIAKENDEYYTALFKLLLSLPRFD